jgi:hypothetical protein
LVCEDVDGLPLLDYLGEGFRALHSGTVLADAVREAYSFVEQEAKRWRAEKNSKLAFRYALLQRYFDARRAIWP